MPTKCGTCVACDQRMTHLMCLLTHQPKPSLPGLHSTAAFRLSSYDFITLLLNLVTTRFQGFTPIKVREEPFVQMRTIEDKAKKEGMHSDHEGIMKVYIYPLHVMFQCQRQVMDHTC